MNDSISVRLYWVTSLSLKNAPVSPILKQMCKPLDAVLQATYPSLSDSVSDPLAWPPLLIPPSHFSIQCSFTLLIITLSTLP